jgi:hypothetical protein
MPGCPRRTTKCISKNLAGSDGLRAHVNVHKCPHTRIEPLLTLVAACSSSFVSLLKLHYCILVYDVRCAASQRDGALVYALKGAVCVVVTQRSPRPYCVR